MNLENQTNDTEEIKEPGVSIFNEQNTPIREQSINESYFGKPEKYDYSGIPLPENYCYNDELLDEFNKLAAEYNLSQKGADGLMSIAVKLAKLNDEYFQKNLADQTRLQTEKYQHLLNNDKEIGGAKLLNTFNTANLAYSAFANEEARKALSQSGLNCHPDIVRMFFKIGKCMQNDDVYGINSAPVLKENREDILFPTM